jgi:hypothetical protein
MLGLALLRDIGTDQRVASLATEPLDIALRFRRDTTRNLKLKNAKPEIHCGVERFELGLKPAIRLPRCEGALHGRRMGNC